MLVQAIKEIFLLLMWRELTVNFKAKGWIRWRVKSRPGFELLQLLFSWTLAIFLLTVSVPHSVEIIHLYERGDTDFRNIKSVLLAVTIEVIAALLLLVALHTHSLDMKKRKALFYMALPFVLITLHLQLVYYAGPADPGKMVLDKAGNLVASGWEIYPWELALILPGGVLVCAVLVAFLLPVLNQQRVLQTAAPAPVPVPAPPVDLSPILDELRRLREAAAMNSDAIQRLAGSFQGIDVRLSKLEEAEAEEPRFEPTIDTGDPALDELLKGLTFTSPPQKTGSLAGESADGGEPVNDPLPELLHMPVLTARRYDLDELLSQAGFTRGKALEVLAENRIKSAAAAWKNLKLFAGSKLPAEMTSADFEPLYLELLGAGPIPEAWQAPGLEMLNRMGNVEACCMAYRMKRAGMSNKQIAVAFGKSSDTTARTWHREHATRFDLPLLS